VVSNFINLISGGAPCTNGVENVDDDEGEAAGVDSQLFREAPAGRAAESLAMVARRHPGRLFEQGLGRIRERLVALQGGTGAARDGLELCRVLSFYHEVVFRPRVPGRMSVHTEREMATLAECVDCLVEGDLGRLGDIMLQRYKALEKSVQDESWTIAAELEVLEHSRTGLATDEEVFRGTKRQLHTARLQQTLANLSRRASDERRDHVG